MSATKKETAATGEATISKQQQKKSNTNPSQKQIVLRELKLHKGKGITSWDLIMKHRITRLGARIWELRHKDGLDIESKIEYTADGKRYCRYVLHK